MSNLLIRNLNWSEISVVALAVLGFAVAWGNLETRVSAIENNGSRQVSVLKEDISAIKQSLADVREDTRELRTDVKKLLSRGSTDAPQGSYQRPVQPHQP